MKYIECVLQYKNIHWTYTLYYKMKYIHCTCMQITTMKCIYWMCITIKSICILNTLNLYILLRWNVYIPLVYCTTMKCIYWICTLYHNEIYTLNLYYNVLQWNVYIHWTTMKRIHSLNYNELDEMYTFYALCILNLVKRIYCTWFVIKFQAYSVKLIETFETHRYETYRCPKYIYILDFVHP